VRRANASRRACRAQAPVGMAPPCGTPSTTMIFSCVSVRPCALPNSALGDDSIGEPFRLTDCLIQLGMLLSPLVQKLDVDPEVVGQLDVGRAEQTLPPRGDDVKVGIVDRPATVVRR